MELSIANVLPFIPEEQNLEARIQTFVDAASSTTASDEDRARFRRSIRDRNKLHDDIELATQMGFPDRPQVGMYSAAVGGKTAKNVLLELQQFQPRLLFTGQDIEFKRGIFPSDKTKWQIVGYDKNTEDPNGFTLVTRQNKGLKPARITKSYFNESTPALPETEGVRVYATDFSIGEQDQRDYHEPIGDQLIAQRLAPMQTIGLVTGALYDFLERLNEHNETQVGGGNLAMESRFLESARPGELHIDIYRVSEENKDRRGWVYPFRGIVSQDGEVVAYTDITTLANDQLDTTAFVSEFN